MPETFGSGVAWIDYDNDGLPDLFFSNGADLARGKPSPGNVLYHNLGNGKFEDVTKKAGVAGNGMFATGATVGDYDNDGFLDLFVTGYNSRQLFHNNGDGTFTDVTAKSGVAGGGWSSSAAWVDYDRDGYLDLYVVRYLDYEIKIAPYCGYKQEGYRMYCDPQQFDGVPDQLFHNNHDGTFTDVSVKAGIANRAGKGLGVVIGDIDLDGWPDIFVTNDGVRNFLYRNKGDGTFQDITYTSNTGFDMNGKAMAGMGTEIADFDGDGLPDIFLTAFSREYNTLYRNLGKLQFEDVTLKAGLQSGFLTLAFGTKLFDYDNDGDLDIFCTNGHVTDNVELYDPQLSYRQSDLLYENIGGGKFKDVSAESGPAFRVKHVGRGAADRRFRQRRRPRHRHRRQRRPCPALSQRWRQPQSLAGHQSAGQGQQSFRPRFEGAYHRRRRDAISRDQSLRQLPEHQRHAALCRAGQRHRRPAPGNRVAQRQEASTRKCPGRSASDPGRSQRPLARPNGRVPSSSINHKRPERIAGRCDQILPAVQHVSLRRIRDAADARVPQRLSGGRVVRHQVARAIARKEQPSRRGQQSATAAVAIIAMSPGDLARLIIDRREIAAADRRRRLLPCRQAPSIRAGPRRSDRRSNTRCLPPYRTARCPESRPAAPN